MSKSGVTQDLSLVLCGASLQYATYAKWVCYMRSHFKIKILDGSRPLWEKEGRPMQKEILQPAMTEYPVPMIDDTPRISRQGVLAGLNDPDRVLIGLRTPEEYSGARVSPGDWEVDHGAERHGRIPGARHLFFEELLDDDMRFLPNEKLRASFEQRGAMPDDEIVLYCRLSHRGTLGWTVLTKFLGYTNVRVYDGSWTEWGSMVGMPVEP
jgi:thiosulfate/3-mercaptopyruvate sulfurtransferase